MNIPENIKLEAVNNWGIFTNIKYELSSIKLINKKMFTRTQYITSLFAFNTELIKFSENFRLDLREFKFSSDVHTNSMFRGLTDITLPDDFYKYGSHKKLFAFCSLDREEILKCCDLTEQDKIKTTGCSCIVDEIKYSDIINSKNKKLIQELLSNSILRLLILDADMYTADIVSVSTCVNNIKIQAGVNLKSDELMDVLSKLADEYVTKIADDIYNFPNELTKDTETNKSISLLADRLAYTEGNEKFTELIEELKNRYGKIFKHTVYTEKLTTYAYGSTLNIYSDLPLSEIKQWVILMAINHGEVNNPVQEIRLYPEGTYKHKN